MRARALLVVLFIALPAAASAYAMDMHPAAGLASAHHTVLTRVPKAQAYFDEGLTLLYSFNRVAARHAFEQAAHADPRLAMAQWGIAMSYGPNINVSIDAAGEQAAYAALRRARQLASNAGELDRAWITALGARYSPAANPDFAHLASAYASAMKALVAKYPDDLDATTLYAESLMDLRPWALYSPGGHAVAGTRTIVTTLESVMAREPDHIGANHFYIHATEASTTPERALVAAQRLSSMNFEAAAAHLVHMPAHTYMRTGSFESAAMSNEHATQHDRSYLANTEDREASGYYQHNLTMLAYGYSMQGDYSGAAATSKRLADSGAMVPALYVPLRFAHWSEILAMSQPPQTPDEPMRGAFWHFSRGMAFAGSSDLANARTELGALKSAEAALILPALAGFSNSSPHLFAIAQDVLDAAIAQASGEPATAVALLQDAVKLQDGLIYIEPPDWYRPEREALGGLLVRLHRYGEAETVFRADLTRNPRNPRSLFGLAAALEGQGRAGDAQLVRLQFQSAWQHADTTLSIEML